MCCAAVFLIYKTWQLSLLINGNIVKKKDFIRKLAFVSPFDCHINLKGKMDMLVGFCKIFSIFAGTKLPHNFSFNRDGL